MSRFIELATVNSTNNWLAERAHQLTPPVFVRAEGQTAGRGRLERSWFSGAPGENLMMSALLHFPHAAPATVPVVAALALRAALPHAEKIRIKWPNDIYYEGRKLAGILCERIQGQPQSIIIGIGVNVNGETFPTEISETATSLRRISGETQNIRRLWISVCRSLVRSLRNLTPALSAQTVAEFNAHAWRYILRPEVSAAPLEFQTLLSDGRAQCNDSIILDMAG